jgi:hypothetical protein
MRFRWLPVVAVLLTACDHGNSPTEPTPTPTPATHITNTFLFRYWDYVSQAEHWVQPTAEGVVYMPADAFKEECAYLSPPKGVKFSGSVGITELGKSGPWVFDYYKDFAGAGGGCFRQSGETYRKSPASIHTYAVDVTDSTGYHLKEAVSLHFWTPGVDEPR